MLTKLRFAWNFVSVSVSVRDHVYVYVSRRSIVSIVL
jgi:hypothetical protein